MSSSSCFSLGFGLDAFSAAVTPGGRLCRRTPGIVTRLHGRSDPPPECGQLDSRGYRNRQARVEGRCSPRLMRAGHSRTCGGCIWRPCDPYDLCDFSRSSASNRNVQACPDSWDSQDDYWCFPAVEGDVWLNMQNQDAHWGATRSIWQAVSRRISHIGLRSVGNPCREVP